MLIDKNEFGFNVRMNENNWTTFLKNFLAEYLNHYIFHYYAIISALLLIKSKNSVDTQDIR